MNNEIIEILNEILNSAVEEGAEITADMINTLLEDYEMGMYN